jgi:carboxyl-terminal processing protease
MQPFQNAVGWLERRPRRRTHVPRSPVEGCWPGLPAFRRRLTGVDVGGDIRLWEEAPTTRPLEPVVSWRRLDSGAGYLRVAVWHDDVDAAIDAALHELRRCESLVVDLRRNPGGSLIAACRTRDRFVRTSTTLGSIRYSLGAGGLSEPTPLRAEPAARAWPGRLVVLTDGLTFSSSEDFLLGLQGLAHVRLVGRPSGGGSGRPRQLRLLPGWLLTVGTALTYDRGGRCVEGAGVPLDVFVAAVALRVRRGARGGGEALAAVPAGLRRDSWLASGTQATSLTYCPRAPAERSS